MDVDSVAVVLCTVFVIPLPLEAYSFTSSFGNSIAG